MVFGKPTKNVTKKCTVNNLILSSLPIVFHKVSMNKNGERPKIKQKIIYT